MGNSISRGDPAGYINKKRRNDMDNEKYLELKDDCETNPTQFNLGYIQALYDWGIIVREQYHELTDLIENSNEYREE